ncbi:MAG: hypothetical protein SGPRY_012317, partial [Prymnesium sp.]
MCVMHDLKADEDRRAKLSESANMINYERLSMSFEGNVQERTEEEQDADLLQGRISSADLYAMGPVTGDRAYNILKERSARKEQERLDKEARASQRAAKSLRRGEELSSMYSKLTLRTQAH